MSNIIAVRLDKSKMPQNILDTVLQLDSTLDTPYGFCITEYRDIKSLVNQEAYLDWHDFDDKGPSNNPFYQLWMNRTCVQI